MAPKAHVMYEKAQREAANRRAARESCASLLVIQSIRFALVRLHTTKCEPTEAVSHKQFVSRVESEFAMRVCFGETDCARDGPTVS